MSARLFLLATAATLTLGGGGAVLFLPGPAETLGVGKSAPAPGPRVPVTDVEGAPAELAPRPGEVVLVAFWASWCDACREELPGLLALGRELERRHPGRFRIVGVSMDEERAPLRRFLGELSRGAAQPGWTVVVDGVEQAALTAYYTAAHGGGVPDDYQLPQTYVVDRSGRLVGWLEGPRDWSSSAARAYLEALLR